MPRFSLGPFLATSFLATLLLGSALLRQSASFRKTRFLNQEEWNHTALKTLTNDTCAANYGPPRLVYNNCSDDAILNIIPLFGGMTNALKMVLLGALMSFEEGRCFYVDESTAHLNPMKNGTKDGFIDKYMEPIGLPKDHPYVKKAFLEKRVQVRPWDEYWGPLNLRRVEGSHYENILGYENVEGHELKRAFIRRMWRLLPKYREATCDSLQQYELGDEFMAFSVRRGDKTLEKFAYTRLPAYLASAEDQMQHFGDKMPNIFVATDDCTVMPHFRELRPDWHFVSECDKDGMHANGFAIADIHKWDEDKEDAHFRKFFVEVYALATSKVFIGVGYTNVAWWVLFLRPSSDNFILLDKPEGRTDQSIFTNW